MLENNKKKKKEKWWEQGSKQKHRQAQVIGSQKSGSGTAERGPTRKWGGPHVRRRNRGLGWEIVGPTQGPAGS